MFIVLLRSATRLAIVVFFERALCVFEGACFGDKLFLGWHTLVVSYPGVLVGTSLILNSGLDCSLLSSRTTTVASAAGGTDKFLLVNGCSTGSLERSLERAKR